MIVLNEYKDLRGDFMISQSTLRKKSIKFLEYMGIYPDDCETEEELDEYIDTLSILEFEAEENGGLIYEFDDESYIVINFIDGEYLIAPVE